MLMTPQTPAEAITQASVYLVGFSTSAWSWANDEKLFGGIIAVLTIILLVTNILRNKSVIKLNQSESALNEARLKQFNDTGKTKPGLPR